MLDSLARHEQKHMHSSDPLRMSRAKQGSAKHTRLELCQDTEEVVCDPVCKNTQYTDRVVF